MISTHIHPASPPPSSLSSSDITPSSSNTPTPTPSRRTSLASHSSSNLLSSVLKHKPMLKLWPSSPSVDQLTPKASLTNHAERQNPFEAQLAQLGPFSPAASAHPPPSPLSSSVSSLSQQAPRSPSAYGFHQHHLLTTHARNASAGYGIAHGTNSNSNTSHRGSSSGHGGDLTPVAAGQSPPTGHASSFAAAIPTTQLSLHAPEFKMQRPPPSRRIQEQDKRNAQQASSQTTEASDELAAEESAPQPIAPSVSTSSTTASSTISTSPSTTTQNGSSSPCAVSRGQLHVKLIQARGLNVHSIHARPYVVVQFEQNEFVSREPTHESEKEVKGVATNLSRNSSSTALNALGAINARVVEAAKRSAANSANTSPQSSVSSGQSGKALAANGAGHIPPSASANGLFGRLSAHNPVWKHQVSFDVTSDQSVITFNVYDRADEEQGFLGMVEIKPVLKHDHTVDQWYKLLPHENEVVTGEMRIQITYEQFKTKRALTPRDFEFLKLIGRGTFGRVFQVRKKDTRRIYAMKVLSKKEIIAKKEIAHTIGERKILQQSLNSPFLVGLKFSFQTDTDLYLVTDFKSGGELFWHLQKETKFSEERARFYIAELVLALEHLHKYDIVYRDLKPENILLDATGHIALCDFGLSKPDLKADQLTNTFCGTTEYLAPEVLLDDHGYSKLVDFWSLGVLLFEMCCGWSPFYAEDTQQMYKNICFGKIRFPKNVIGEDGKQFVKGLLNRNPKHRLGAQRDTEELKEHPFFKTIDWKALAAKQVTPPFIPVVESDESTANFDPEFTSADLSDAGIDDFDDDDPSEDWLSQSFTGSLMAHTPNGPLGSENNLTMQEKQARAIQIQNRRKQRNEAKGSPISSSVQDHFRGFSFTGESVAREAAGRLLEEEEVEVDEDVVQDGVPEEEEYDDDRPVGRLRMRRASFDIQ